jgi:hypothetical protein
VKPAERVSDKRKFVGKRKNASEFLALPHLAKRPILRRYAVSEIYIAPFDTEKFSPSHTYCEVEIVHLIHSAVLRLSVFCSIATSIAEEITWLMFLTAFELNPFC